jgi:hypothetical protein
MNTDEQFEMNFSDRMITVQQVQLPGQVFFKISFRPGEPPLVILRATGVDGQKFWTSMPEGQQELAEQVGWLIEQRYRSINK